MTRRNDKRNNRRNRQRNNGNDEVSMMLGAIMSKAFDEVFGKKDDEDSSGIHAEGITNKDINNINNGNATLYKLRIPDDGSAVEYPTPDNLQFFFNEEGKLMVRKKPKDEPEPITYDDICKELFYNKDTYYLDDRNKISSFVSTSSNYKDFDNCTSIAQTKRLAAFNKLQNIAKYLNKGWKPKFDGKTVNWCICYETKEYMPKATSYLNDANVFFSSKDVTLEAIRIMGKKSLNDLFNKYW